MANNLYILSGFPQTYEMISMDIFIDHTKEIEHLYVEGTFILTLISTGESMECKTKQQTNLCLLPLT